MLEELEDTKRGTYNPYIEEGRRHNRQKKRDKRTNDDQQNMTQKIKDRATRTPLKTGSELKCSGSVSNSCSISGIRRVKSHE